MRPPLSALRLQPQLTTAAAAAAAAAAAGAAGPQQSKAAYLTPNNIQHGGDYGHDSATASGSASSRIEDYGGLMPPGGGSELTRRPSVAIGGVRSPSNLPNKMESDHLAAMNSMAYPNNSRSPAGMLPSGFGPASSSNSYSNNNNINNNSSSSVHARKNSQDQFGLRGPMSQPLQQQQQQQLQQHQYSSNYNQAGYDGGMYSSSGDEMRDTGHGQLERGRSSLRRGPALSGSSSFVVSGGYVESNNPSYNFQQAMNDHFDHYKRPPSRDRSRDPSMDRFSRSSRQSSIALTRQESSLMGSSRGPSPAPTPSMAVFRSNSRQRPPLTSSSPTPSSSRFHPESVEGANNNNGSLQRRMATPIRVSWIFSFDHQHFSNMKCK